MGFTSKRVYLGAQPSSDKDRMCFYYYLQPLNAKSNKVLHLEEAHAWTLADLSIRSSKATKQLPKYLHTCSCCSYW